MLVLENTIFTFNQFPNNDNVEEEYDNTFDPILMDDYTQNPNPYSFVADKIDYDDYCPSPGIIDTQNEENISPVRRHRFSICKATDPQCIINYRRLSNACTSIIPSPNGNNISNSGNNIISASFPNTPYTIQPPLLFDDRKEDKKIPVINEFEGTGTPTLENSIFLNISRSYPNVTTPGGGGETSMFKFNDRNNDRTNDINNNNQSNNQSNNNFKSIASPFHTILTPNTFKAVLTPDQIIDNTYNNRDLDDQFRLFNYTEEDDDDDDDDDSYPSALNSNGQINIDDGEGMIMLNKNLQFNSKNNIKNSEIVTSISYEYNKNSKNITNNDVQGNRNIGRKEEDGEEEEEEDFKASIEQIRERAELESKAVESIEQLKIEKKIKTYSQNVQGLYGLWKDNLSIGFKSLLRE
ncbi:hypothetical protein U3516DRAFT_813377 [Neocallimastix sp. 'constans']|jgi:hypothetical protein